MTPFILQVSKQYEDYSEDVDISNPKDMQLSEFMKVYFSEGLSCLFVVDDPTDTCNYSFLPLLGYVFSLFVIQLALNYVSRLASCPFCGLKLLAIKHGLPSNDLSPFVTQCDWQVVLG